MDDSEQPPSTGSGQAKKSWHDWYIEERSSGERVADKIASFVGSWPFVYIHIVWFGVWILLPVEPFPYGLLTMIVSLEAILLATLILMAQNRQEKRDRHRSEADYETDLEAEKRVELIQGHLKRLEKEKLDKILNILESK